MIQPRGSFAMPGWIFAIRESKNSFSFIRRVQDLPRHLGQHSGGMVICQGQLDSVVPLEPAAMPGRVVVQWDKEDCADLGLIKVDLLGLGMMAVLEDSIQLIRDAYGEEVDLAHLPADDPRVYAALQKADTIGCFRLRAGPRCLVYRGCGRKSSMTSWFKWPLFVPVRLSAIWSILI